MVPGRIGIVRAKFQVLFVLVAVTLLLGAGTIGVTRWYLETHIVSEERTLTEASFYQLQAWFASRSEFRKAMASDWGFWDETWEHMEARDASFASDNMKPDDLLKSGNDLVALVDTAGNVADFACYMDVSGGGKCTGTLKQHLAELVPGWHVRGISSLSGVVELDGECFVLAASEIVPNTHPGHSRGYMVMANHVSKPMIPLPVAMENLTLWPSSGRQELMVRLAPGFKDSLDVVMPLAGVAGFPSMEVRARMPRAYYQESLQALDYWSAVLLVGGVLLAALVAWLIHRLVFVRMELLRRDLAEVGVRGFGSRVRPLGSDDIGELASQVNATLDALDAARAEVENQRLVDRLTNLPNRTAFLARLEDALLRLGPDRVGILLVNLDRFQLVNDSLGWESGDGVLRAVADRLRTLRVPCLARLGGDEFGMLLEDASGIEALRKAADRVQSCFSSSFEAGKGREDIRLSCSIGVSVGRDFEGGPVSDAIRRAEVALHRAQKDGGARTSLFNPEMEQKVRERVELERELREALEEGQFRVAYQPILELANGVVAGFEALVRWKSPRLGLVQPNSFIPLAEQTGLIIGIGEWVLAESCRQMQLWQHVFPMLNEAFLSVNLSVRQFRDKDLVEQIRTTVGASGFPFHRLKLEITESAMMDDPDDFKARLSALRAMGIHIALDDFGTGYSSLRYLDEFPVQTLKVDKSFVDRIAGDCNPAIVRSVVLMAHGLGLDVVAEGIEEPGQAVTLRGIGCEYGQGYLFSRPQFHEEMEDWLQHYVPQVVMA